MDGDWRTALFGSPVAATPPAPVLASPPMHAGVADAGTSPSVALLFASIPDAVPVPPAPLMSPSAIAGELPPGPTPLDVAVHHHPGPDASQIHSAAATHASAPDSAVSTPHSAASRAAFHSPAPYESSGRSSNPHPVPGTKLEGAEVVYRPVLTKETESEERQMQVTPITLYQSEVTYQHGTLIAVNNNYICYAIRGGHIRVINKNSGQRTLLKGHTAGIVDVKFYAPDVDLLASVGRDGVLNVWRIFESAEDAIGHEVAFCAPAAEDGGAGVRDIYRRLAWHPHNTLMFATAAAADATVWVWRAAAAGRAAQCISKCALTASVDVSDVAFSPDGRLVATGCGDGHVRVYDVAKCAGGGGADDGPALSAAGLAREVEAHAGRPVSAVAFAGAHRHHAQQTGGGAAFSPPRLMLTGAANNAEFCVFECGGWTRLQRLVLEGVGSPAAPPAFYNLAAIDPSGTVLLVANTTQNALYALHVGSHGFDLATEFAVTQPIVSFCVACAYRPRTTPPSPAGHAPHAATPPRGAVATELQIYCVQAKAIQQYHLRLEHCTPSAPHAAPHTPHGAGHSGAHGGGTPRPATPRSGLGDAASIRMSEAVRNEGPATTLPALPPSPAPVPAEPAPPPGPSSPTASPAPPAALSRAPLPKSTSNTTPASPSPGPLPQPPRPASPLGPHGEHGKAVSPVGDLRGTEPPSPSSAAAHGRSDSFSSGALPPPPVPGAADVQRAVVKELRRMEEKLERLVVQQTEKHVGRLEKERVERERAERERQERLLTAVSQTIHSTLPQQVEAIVGRSLQGVAPSLRADVDASVARAVAEATKGGGAVASAVLAGLAPKIERTVREAVAAATASMTEELANRLSGNLRAAVQEGFKAQFGGTLVPAFEASCRRMFEQINATFDRGMDERIQKPFAEYFRTATANLSQASSALTGLADTVTFSVAEQQRALLAALARIPAPAPPAPAAPHPPAAPVLSASVQALLGSAAPPPPPPLAPVPVPEVREGPREAIGRLAREERFEAAFNTALSAGDVELVAWLCASLPVERVFASAASPPLGQAVLVSLIQHLGFDLHRDAATKLRWLQAACLALNPARQEAVVRDVVPRVLGQLHAHLQNAQRSLVVPPGDVAAANIASQLRLVTHLVHSLLSGS